MIKNIVRCSLVILIIWNLNNYDCTFPISLFISFIFYSVYWIEWSIFSNCHIVKSDLKTTFEENIILTLKRCSELDAADTQEKCKFPHYQEYWSSESCSFKGCRFRITKLLLLNIKLLKHWIMVIIISARDGVLGDGSSLLLS